MDMAISAFGYDCPFFDCIKVGRAEVRLALEVFDDNPTYPLVVLLELAGPVLAASGQVGYDPFEGLCLE